MRIANLEGFYYRKILRGDEVVECLVLKELKPTAGEMVRWKAVSENNPV